ncbi:MAG: putative caspase-like protein, partial [Cellvibrionaceae bacterium]
MSTGNRYALIITNNKYDDSAFRPLITPQADGVGMRSVLTDPAVAAFPAENVRVLHDQSNGVIKRAITDFYRGKGLDDFLFVYFSGHGALDPDFQLYFAVKDTEKDYLTTSGIEARFVDKSMKQSRAKRKVLVLDCCHSGAFVDG